MKKIGLILFVLFILIISCRSKKQIVDKSIGKQEVNYIPYYLKVYEADSLFLVNDFDGSFRILDSLFKKYEPLNIEGWYEYGNYLISAVMSGHTQNIDEKIRKSYIEYGGVLCVHPDAFKLKDTLRKFSKLTTDEINSLKKEYFSKLNLTLRNEIVRMMSEDQFVRVQTNDDIGMEKYEKLHYVELKEIFEKYGFPTTKLVGSDNYFDETADIRALLMHQSDKAKSEFLPKLLDWVKKGKCDPSIYAAVFDKKMWEKEGKQYYGTFPINEPNKFNYPPMSEPTKIDSIRKTVGLPGLFNNDWRIKKLSEENN